MPKYTEGVCADGAGIMKDGWLMTIEQVLEDLNKATKGQAVLSNSTDLLYCPCCGKVSEKIMVGGYWQYICNVLNGGCGTSSGKYEDLAEAKEYWSKRAL